MRQLVDSTEEKEGGRDATKLMYGLICGREGVDRRSGRSLSVTSGFCDYSIWRAKRRWAMLVDGGDQKHSSWVDVDAFEK